MNNLQCIVCGNTQNLKFELKHKVYKCPSCDLYSSDAAFDLSFQSSLEEDSREIGLKKLRLHNFELIVKALKGTFFKEMETFKGLEIGSGNGWWLEVCRANNIDCIGIEPENTFADYYEKNKLNVVKGFYPNESTASEEGYDFIIFNDVFEHISDLNNLLLSIKKDLKKSGILIINIPMSSGFFYRTATTLYYLKIKSFLDRLWQFNFHSPHINYFNAKNLSAYINQYGFKLLQSFRLETLDFSSIKERIMADSKISKPKAYAISSLLVLIKPIIQNTSADIRVFFFRQ
ncbi:class I SAM-dependent methyltransferase [Emticicia sp. BO119]|uniref:class I SAM-dependent methyltransferase n=1 Tax=Emticicia sp. BO119 TaxID=2757768 RepID=UPI0015F01DC0|nr:class I SAM-dependent methyltransferase [Emticicia sp. BO119]MBA4853026.1 class I SAM-dependent methyltransferase [Emticicia sp. BO119]